VWVLDAENHLVIPLLENQALTRWENLAKVFSRIGSGMNKKFADDFLETENHAHKTQFQLW
jgi:hypothetical protein